MRVTLARKLQERVVEPKSEKRHLHLVEDGVSTKRGSEDPPPSLEQLIDQVLIARTKKLHFFRPSMLPGCDRANYFHYTSAPWHPQRQRPQMLRILDNGTAIHKVVQDYLADHPEWWFAPEARVFVQVAGATIRGSCDGVLIRRSDMYKVGVEIKSIAHEGWLKLTKPKPEHVIQASIYMHLQNLEWIVILYWDKDKQNFKEYPVRRNVEHWKRMKGRIKELFGYVQAKEIPAFDQKTCDPSFCAYVDHCRRKGAPI